MTWYESSINEINEIRSANPNLEGDELRKVLRKNYPFAERKGFAYREWLRAVSDTCGKKPYNR